MGGVDHFDDDIHSVPVSLRRKNEDISWNASGSQNYTRNAPSRGIIVHQQEAALHHQGLVYIYTSLSFELICVPVIYSATPFVSKTIVKTELIFVLNTSKHISIPRFFFVS